MQFNEVKNKKNHYSSINEMLKDSKRKDIILSFEDISRKIRQEMFDKYNVENFYLSGSILEKNQYNAKGVLMIEMTKENFEKMVDEHYLDQYNMDFIVLLDDKQYYLKNKKWIEEEKSSDFKLSLWKGIIPY